MLVEGGTVRSRINWTGVLAGLVVGVVTQLALTALGVAIGAATIDSARGLAIGTIAWLAVSLAISAWLAGLTASRATGYLTPAQGRFNGLLTGMLLALGLTLFSYNALLGGIRTAVGLAQGVTNAASAAANSEAGQTAAQGPLQSVLNGLDEQEIGQIIGENSPELSTEQATAAARVVSGIVRRAGNDIGDNLSNLSNLDEVLTNRVAAIQSALQGEDFVNRLTRQGLSETEARATATAVSEQAATLRDQARRTAEAAARTARTAASTAAWSWLLAAGVILGLATLGGGHGSDVPPTGATTRDADAARRQRT